MTVNSFLLLYFIYICINLWDTCVLIFFFFPFLVFGQKLMIGGRVWWVAIRSTWRADVYSGVKSIYKETHNGHYLFPLLYFCEKTSLIRSPKVLSKVKNCLILLFKNDENTITLYTLFSLYKCYRFYKDFYVNNLVPRKARLCKSSCRILSFDLWSKWSKSSKSRVNSTFTLWVLSKQPFYYAFHLFLFLFHALQLFSFLKKTNFPDNLKKHKSKTIPKNSILFKPKHDFKNKIWK